jgi:hypothetical protein
MKKKYYLYLGCSLYSAQEGILYFFVIMLLLLCSMSMHCGCMSAYEAICSSSGQVEPLEIFLRKVVHDTMHRIYNTTNK